jgi:23S rRNA (adenine2503-C2)-methyltransferase
MWSAVESGHKMIALIFTHIDLSIKFIMEVAVANKKDIRKLSLSQIKEFLVEKGEQGFRAKQVYEWLWKKSVQSFDEMTNL